MSTNDNPSIARKKLDLGALNSLKTRAIQTGDKQLIQDIEAKMEALYKEIRELESAEVRKQFEQFQ